MTYNRKDFYFFKAKKENFAARSVYKLEEIDQKFRIFKRGDAVLDLGAAPGSWSQFVSKTIGQSGFVVGIDLQAIKISLPNVRFIEGDFFAKKGEIQILLDRWIKRPFDVVISDMAPKTTGIAITDQARSLELCQTALTLAIEWLRPGGKFICKLFHGGEFEILRGQLRDAFDRVEVLRPKSTRKESKEIFLIGMGLKHKTKSGSIKAEADT